MSRHRIGRGEDLEAALERVVSDPDVVVRVETATGCEPRVTNHLVLIDVTEASVVPGVAGVQVLHPCGQFVTVRRYALWPSTVSDGRVLSWFYVEAE